jgi:hypothetical protein
MKKQCMLCLSTLILVTTLTASAHEHIWKEATCTEPMTCTVCGETEGEALGHTWEEATCTEPKICSVCGETEGNPLGHTREVGRCSICGKLINPELCQNVYETMEKISGADNEALEATNVEFSSLPVAYSASIKAQAGLDKVYDYCGELISLCGDYSELQSLKTAAESMQKNAPSPITGQDQKAVESWYGEYASHCKASSDLFSSYANFLETLKH